MSMVKTEPVWLVDASIYVFRAWFTMPDNYKDQQGQNVNAVLGFINFVDDLLRKENPKQIAFAFDESLEHSHRKEIFPDYKANRESAPENLRYQFQLCRQYVRALGIVEAASSCFEADDLIASWAKHHENCIVVTADKDLAQLVGVNDYWFDYAKGVSLDYKAITKKFGVQPEQIADQLAIAGDKVDNIPGVPGIGMATAAKLLRYFGDIDRMLESIEQIGIMKFRGAFRVQTLIQEYQQQILCYRQITTLVNDIPDLVYDLRRQTVKADNLKQLSNQIYGDDRLRKH